MEYLKQKIKKIKCLKFFMAISSQIVSLFHKNGLKSSLLKQIDHFKNFFYLKFNFKHDRKNRFYKKALYFSKT